MLSWYLRYYCQYPEKKHILLSLSSICLSIRIQLPTKQQKSPSIQISGVTNDSKYQLNIHFGSIQT